MAGGGRFFAWTTAFLAITLNAARADEPFVTDDARILEKGACQLEVSALKSTAQRERRLVPTCNPTGKLELALGQFRSSAADAHNTIYAGQIKGVWRDYAEATYGIGWSASVNAHRHPAAAERRIAQYAGSVLLSRGFRDETFVIHANFGATHGRDQSKAGLTSALAFQFVLTSRVMLLAETYDATDTRRAYQAGARWTVIPDRLEIYTTIGGEARDFRPSRYWAVALHAVTPPLLGQ